MKKQVIFYQGALLVETDEVFSPDTYPDGSYIYDNHISMPVWWRVDSRSQFGYVMEENPPAEIQTLLMLMKGT